jgi:heptosyltransferase I
MKNSPKFLIIRLSSLGDVLHALPAFSGLRATFPAAQIDWLTGPQSRFLVSAIPGVDTIHVLDSSGLGKFPPQRQPWSKLKALIGALRAQNYDYSIDFQGLLKTAVAGSLSGAHTRVGFSRDLVREPPAHWFYTRTPAKPDAPRHITVLNQMLTELVGAHSVCGPCRLHISEEDRGFVDSLLHREQLKDFVVLNPGGGWPTKRWAPERYGVLAEKIQSELGLPVAVTTGPGEEAYYLKIVENCKPAPRHFQLSFLQLIPLMEKAQLVIGGDTGPFHLACALGRAVVGIFGPTAPVRNGPWNPDDSVVTRALPCSFCHKRTCPTSNECMDISADDVLRAVRRRLETAPRATAAGSR